ncbi:MAG: class I SAM-dependent methyltransferase [Thermoleophilaceae bacterium]
MESSVAVGNEEAVEAWDGVLFDVFKKYRHILVAGLGAHSDAAMALHPPPAGGRVIDIGCGFGDTTQELAELAGPDGYAVGIDAAPNFIELATHEAEEAGAQNVRFEVCDPQASALDEKFDYAFSRMGVMFFGNPVAAMRNVRAMLNPGGQIIWCVWRPKIENPWTARAEEIVLQFMEHPDPEDSDEPTCGPGPFSMGDANTVSNQLTIAGFEDINFYRSDRPIVVGGGVEEALELVTSIGPAGEILRLAGEKADPLRPQIEEKLRELYAGYTDDDGAVRAPASVWIISARVPG